MRFSSFLTGAVLAAAIPVSIASVASAAVSPYQITPLDSPTGTTDVYAVGVNTLGQIVGHTVDANGNSHAAMWTASTGAYQPLADLSATNPISEAYRINNHGQIVGKARSDANANHAVLWDTTGAHDIGTLPGGAFSFAQDINDNGVIAGSSGAAHGQHAFTWTTGGGMVDNGSQNPNSNQALAGWNAINNNGLLAGTSYILLSPFKASMGHLGDTMPTQISPPGQFSNGMALAVNDAGTIVGWQSAPSGGSPHAAIFDGHGGFQNLGSFGLSDSWAEDINESGVIVGRAFGDDGTGTFVNKAYVHQDGQMTDLMSVLTNGTGWTELFSASAISDNGVIVGAGVYNGEIRGFVLNAVPEPATASLLTCAIAGIATMGRRRRNAC
jgi:probable HAF family extracellular repeat protein